MLRKKPYSRTAPYSRNIMGEVYLGALEFLFIKNFCQLVSNWHINWDNNTKPALEIYEKIWKLLKAEDNIQKSQNYIQGRKKPLKPLRPLRKKRKAKPNPLDNLPSMVKAELCKLVCQFPRFRFWTQE